jgi:predicted dehydrogenase
LGSIGRRHLRNLIALGQDDIVLYRTGKATLPDDELGQFPVEHDLDRALKRWRPDATIIANPTSRHMDAASAASKAGSHLFIEKPISHTMDSIQELQGLIGNNELKALIGFQFRFHPGLLHVKNLLDDKALGEVLSAKVEWGEYLPNWHPWEDYRNSYSARRDLGGGVVLTLCHPFDYLRWLLGEVREVTAEIGNTGQLDLDVEDTADATLRFEAGYLATVHLDYLQRPDIHQLKIIGSEGTLLWDNADGSVRWWSTDSNEWPTLTVPKEFERNQLFLDEMKHFIHVLSGEAEPQCSLEDGIQALKIALAVHQSAKLGKRVELKPN